MRIFVTGGTGTIGSAVVAELLGNGHTVLALARSDASARAVEAAGAEPLRGGIADLDVLRAGAAQAEGVIALAFGRDYGDPDALARAVAEEGAALGALGDELVGSDRPIVTVSGTPWVPGRAATEADPLPTDGPVGGRGLSVNALLDLASRGVRSSAVRMPRTVHNEGKGGFAGLLAGAARRSGVSGYPGDGSQRWPAVHALDAAVLFRLALESAPAGTSWHAVADEGDAVRDIATVIGRRLGLPVETVPEENFGPFGPIFAMDSRRLAPTRATPSGGSRPTPACSTTWRTLAPSSTSQDRHATAPGAASTPTKRGHHQNGGLRCKARRDHRTFQARTPFGTLTTRPVRHGRARRHGPGDRRRGVPSSSNLRPQEDFSCAYSSPEPPDT